MFKVGFFKFMNDEDRVAASEIFSVIMGAVLSLSSVFYHNISKSFITRDNLAPENMHGARDWPMQQVVPTFVRLPPRNCGRGSLYPIRCKSCCSRECR